MNRIVLKIGGTALADAACFEQAKRVIDSEKRYAIIVPSAPARVGARMTELLRSLAHCEDRSLVYWTIEEWLLEIVRKNGLGEETEGWIRTQLIELSAYIDTSGSNCSWTYVTSRGEFWIGTLLAKYCEIELVDSKDVIKFTLDGAFDPRATKRALKAYNLPERFVLTGFYGSDKNGNIYLFPRNGSDISAAIIAVYVGAIELHIARKGVPGVYVMNPDLYDGSISGLKVIPYLSHEQAREMTYRSDSALHPLALVPIAKVGMMVRIFDINRPGDPGTSIVHADHPKLPQRWKVLGLAERAGFTVFTLKRIGMNERTDFTDRIASVLKEFAIGYEHQTTGVDHVSLTIKNDDIRSRQEAIAKSFQKACRAKVTYVISEASICIVGHDLGSNPYELGYLHIALGTSALCESPCPNMRYSFQSQTAAGTSLVLGVPAENIRNAVNRLYREINRKR